MEAAKTHSHKNLLLVIFIIGSATITSTILLFYSYLLKELVPPSNLIREYCICIGQILFQTTLLLLFSKKTNILVYIDQMMIVSLTGGLLLLPVLISSFIFFPFSPGVYYYLAYFFIIVAFMFFSHKKRVKQINAPLWLTYSWVAYRLIVLLIIL